MKERNAGALVLVGLTFAAIVLQAGMARAAPARTSVTCTMFKRIPVLLTTAAPGIEDTVAGELCATPRELTNGATVQLLLHGATYNHRYWDFATIDGVRYSYARDVAAAGIPTFALDEIGAGQSSHPSSAVITIQVAAYVAHEVVQDLLNGTVTGFRFGRVIEVGHSFGSITTIDEAATYHDVAGAIITGDTHMTPVFTTVARTDMYSALSDPKFAKSGIDGGYLTTRPGTRATLFYNSADADPNVITADEAGKDVFSATEFGTGIALKTTDLSQQISAPVLLIDGTDDALDCGAETTGGSFDCSSGDAIARQEAPYYSTFARLRACSIPDAGHDVNLALNHSLEEIDAAIWSYEYVGQGPSGTFPSRMLPPDCSPIRPSSSY